MFEKYLTSYPILKKFASQLFPFKFNKFIIERPCLNGAASLHIKLNKMGFFAWIMFILRDLEIRLGIFWVCRDDCTFKMKFTMHSTFSTNFSNIYASHSFLTSPSVETHVSLFLMFLKKQLNLSETLR